MNPDRFHVTLSRAGRPAVQGWWGCEATASAKFNEWVGEWGGPGVRVTLVDEETGETLTTWPEDG